MTKPKVTLTKKFQFRYGYGPRMTVTVTAIHIEDADMKARVAMDARYAKWDMEPPVSWTLSLIKTKRPKTGQVKHP